MTERLETVYLAPGEPVDLDNCAREPIHVPGSIQPRGVLLAVTEPDLVVRHASENVGPAARARRSTRCWAARWRTCSAPRPPSAIERTCAPGATCARATRSLVTASRRRRLELDVVLHRIAGGESTLLVVELEPASGPRPFSFPNTYQAVRGAVEQLNHAHELAELYDDHGARGAGAHRVRPRDDLPLRRRVQRRGRRGGHAAGPQPVPRAALPGDRHPAAGPGAVREELGPAHLRRRLRPVADRAGSRRGDRAAARPHALDRCAASRPIHLEYLGTWASPRRCRSRCCATAGCGA